jgi:hypothetical protein
MATTRGSTVLRRAETQSSPTRRRIDDTPERGIAGAVDEDPDSQPRDERRERHDGRARASRGRGRQAIPSTSGAVATRTDGTRRLEMRPMPG